MIVAERLAGGPFTQPRTGLCASILLIRHLDSGKAPRREPRGNLTAEGRGHRGACPWPKNKIGEGGEGREPEVVVGVAGTGYGEGVVVGGEGLYMIGGLGSGFMGVWV